MVKISILYPNVDGGTFNLDYYCKQHIPMVAERFGKACLEVSVERGVSGSEPTSPPDFIATAHFKFDTAESFWGTIEPHLQEIMADLPNYTDIKPQFQVSSVEFTR